VVFRRHEAVHAAAVAVEVAVAAVVAVECPAARIVDTAVTRVWAAVVEEAATTVAVAVADMEVAETEAARHPTAAEITTVRRNLDDSLKL